MKLHYGPGMQFHGDRAIEFLDFEPYTPEIDVDEPAMFWLYSERDYELLKAHKGPKFIFWHGTDVLILRKNWARVIDTLVDARHACHNEIQRNLLAEMGIYAHIRPVFWNDVEKYKPTGERAKDVYLTSHKGREVEYGEYKALALSQALPEWNFHIYGTEGKSRENLIYHGEVPEEQMDEETSVMAATLRWKKIEGFHWDGFSQTSMKALLRGHSVISGIKYPYKGCFHVKNIEDMIDELNVFGRHDDREPIKLNDFTWLQ